MSLFNNNSKIDAKNLAIACYTRYQILDRRDLSLNKECVEYILSVSKLDIKSIAFQGIQTKKQFQ